MTEAQTRMREMRIRLFDLWHESAMEGTEFMTVLLAVVRDISCGYILACDKRERFQMNDAVKKEFDSLMEYVNKK